MSRQKTVSVHQAVENNHLVKWNVRYRPVYMLVHIQKKSCPLLLMLELWQDLKENFQLNTLLYIGPMPKGENNYILFSQLNIRKILWLISITMSHTIKCLKLFGVLLSLVLDFLFICLSFKQLTLFLLLDVCD